MYQESAKLEKELGPLTISLIPLCLNVYYERQTAAEVTGQEFLS